jgi:hypothetical protein
MENETSVSFGDFKRLFADFNGLFGDSKGLGKLCSMEVVILTVIGTGLATAVGLVMVGDVMTDFGEPSGDIGTRD